MTPYCPHCHKRMPLRMWLSIKELNACPNCQKPIKGRLNIAKAVLFFIVSFFLIRLIVTAFFGFNFSLYSSGILGGVIGVSSVVSSYSFQKADG